MSDAGERLPPVLARLARHHGIETSYRDFEDVERRARPEIVLAVLEALAGPECRSDPAGVLARARLEAWSAVLPPVVAVRLPAGALRCRLRLPAAQAQRRLAATLRARDGGAVVAEQVVDLAAVPGHASANCGGARFVAKLLELRPPPELGRYVLDIEVGGLRASAHVVAAPQRLGDDGERRLGLFVPLHALRTQTDWGCGDYTGLAALAGFAASVGADLVGTLPLLAMHPANPTSPYTPCSRLVWEERYVDVERAPEFARSAAARAAVADAGFAEPLRAARAARLADPAAVARQKAALFRALRTAASDERRAAFERFVGDRPEALDHARFRARTGAGESDEALAMDLAFAQWLAAEQIEGAAREAAGAGVRLYLDLPTGVHPDGYDAWRHSDTFVGGLSIGAPPDAFFAGGQCWGMPPPHPERIRADGYGYLAACLRHQFRVARWLRLDHVMALHRLYVVPHGADPRDGAYVRYAAGEQYAVVALEAARAGATVVGEDLGTVPPAVRTAMAANGLARMYVLPFELGERGEDCEPPARDQVASLGTHDTPTFAGFFGSDAAAPPGEAKAARARRRELRAALVAALRRQGIEVPAADGDAALLRAALRFLAQSPARAVLVDLADLWLEAEPQNEPGTGAERPNWRRRTRLTLAECARDPRVGPLLAELAALRRARP